MPGTGQESSQRCRGAPACRKPTTRSLAFAVCSHGAACQSRQQIRPFQRSSSIRGMVAGIASGALQGLAATDLSPRPAGSTTPPCARGLTEEQIHQMLVDNPRRILGGGS